MIKQKFYLILILIINCLTISFQNDKIANNNTTKNETSLLSSHLDINFSSNNSNSNTSNFNKAKAYSSHSPISPMLIARAPFLLQNISSKNFNFENLFNLENNEFIEELSNSNEQKKFIQKAFIEFGFMVQDFLSFEPKTASIGLNAQLKYKWWTQDDINDASIEPFSRLNLDANDEPQTDNSNVRTDTFSKYYPILEINDNSVEFKVKNQIYQMDNVEILTEKPFINEFNPNPEPKNFFSERLIKINPKIPIKKYERHYSYLEQNATVKFNCKNSFESDEFEILDFTNFPFDIHQCSLEFDIVPSLYKLLKPEDSILLYEFPNEIINHAINIENFDYFKIVQSMSSNSLMAKEWILKKISLKYMNSTTSRQTSIQIENIDKKENTNKNQYFNELLKLLSKNDINKRDVNNLDKDSYKPARISIDILISRRREPQFYLFLLPLVIFTMITFLIFFIPTTETSEKSLIALLNFAFILFYNIYVFKLIVLTYELIKIPLILKYSNCLMLIQLSVLAYTCLAKSIYQNGFLTLSTKFNQINDSNELYRFKKCINYPKFNQCKNFSLVNSTIDNKSQVKNDNQTLKDNSVKINMPIIKINDSSDDLIKCLADHMLTEESNYTVYNNIDSSGCECNSPTDSTPHDFTEENGNSQHLKSNYGFISDGYIKPTENKIKKIQVSPSFIQRLFCCWFFRPSKLVKLQQSFNTYQNNPCYATKCTTLKNEDTLNGSYKIINDTVGESKGSKTRVSCKLMSDHLDRLIKFEEIKLKDKLLKEEWRRKARYCDGICCLFIFFILAICTFTIFAILPSYKITSMMD